MTRPFVPPLSPMPRPWKCPICQGTGTVGQDFYTKIGYASGTGHVTCRSCGGRGVVIA